MKPEGTKLTGAVACDIINSEGYHRRWDLLTQTLQEAIIRSGKTYLELERLTGVKRGSILRFMRGEHSVLLSNADKLCEYLGLELRPKRRIRKGRA